MKKLAALVLVGLLMVGCTSETPLGDCKGLTDKKDPALVYEYDTGNVVLAVIFSETIIVPLIVVLSSLECPIARRQ